MVQLDKNSAKYQYGLLIRYCREELCRKVDAKLYSLDNFVKAASDSPFFDVIPGQNVCSKSTLIRLERGEMVRDDELYEFFIIKLGKMFKLFPKIDMLKDEISMQLLLAVELMDIACMESLKRKIVTVFKEAKNYFYYDELYTAYHFILSIYCSGAALNEESVSKYLQLYPIFDYHLQQLLLILLYDWFTINAVDVKMQDYIIEELKKMENLSLLSYPCIVSSEIKEKRWKNASDIAEEGMELAEKIYSDYLLGEFYYLKALSCNSGNADDLRKYYAQSISHMAKCRGDYASKKLAFAYCNIGFEYYKKKDFSLSYDYFRHCLAFQAKFRIPYLFYILDCMIELNLDYAAVLSDEHEEKISSHDKFLVILKNYYEQRIDANADCFVLQDYIVRSVYPFLKKKLSDKYLVMFFNKEMIRLTKVTKKYKELNLFSELVSQND